MRPIDGMSVLITGGGSGLGEGTARHFADRGARVTITGRRGDRVAAVARELGEAGRAVVGDVTVDADRRAMVDAAVEHGGGRLDVVISNAGNMYRAPVEDLDEQQLLEVFHTNVVGGMMLTGLAVPHLEPVARLRAVRRVGAHPTRPFPGRRPTPPPRARWRR